MSEQKRLEKRRKNLMKATYVAAVLASASVCTVSHAQVTREWDGDSNDNFNTATNWSANTAPVITDQASFGSISTPENVVTVTGDAQVNRIRFVDGANAQSFNLRINAGYTLDVHGNSAFGDETFGIANSSGYTQSLTVMGPDANINFNGSSNLVNSGINSNIHISNVAGGSVTFNENSSAGDANTSITNEAGGTTYFNDTSNAGLATITNNADGTTYFNNSSDGGDSTIINNAGGSTFFLGASTADSGTGDGNVRTNITNSGTGNGPDSGRTLFNNASAGSANITNNEYGNTLFSGNSDAGTALITNNMGGATYFSGDASASSATITNAVAGATVFEGNAQAGNATITNNTGMTVFNDSSSAGNATLVNILSGNIIFNDLSQGGTATIRNGGGGTVTIDTDVDGTNFTVGHLFGAGNVVLHDSLTIDATGTSTPLVRDFISGVISGSGGLTKEGENTLRLTGNNTYTGNTLVNNGVVEIIGSITSNTTINSDGELRGNGTITGNLTNNGGRLQAGDPTDSNPYSTLTVTGNFNMAAPNSVLVSRVGRDIFGAYNNVVRASTGTATLDGLVEVHVDQEPGTMYLVNNQYTLVSAANRVGTFDGVELVDSSIPTFLSLTEDAVNGINGGLSYDTGNAYINLQRNTLDDLIDGVNLTRNQRAVYNSLNNVDFGDLTSDQEAVINEFVYDSYYAGSSVATSLLSGDALTAYPVAAQGAANRFNQRLLSQVTTQGQSSDEYAVNRSPRLVYSGNTYRTLLAQSDAAARSEAEAAASNRSSIWATIARAKEDTDSDGNGPGFDTRATEYQVGYNRKISDRTTVGFSIGKSDADITVDNRSAKGDLDTTSFGAFIRHDNDDLYFSGLLSYSRHDIDSTRATNIFNSVSADYDARTIGLWGEVGKKMERGSLKIEPHISLKLSNTKQDSFSESGFGGLDVSAEKYNTRRLGLGVRLASGSTTSKFRPYGFVGYEREFGDEQAELTGSVAGLSSFNVKGSQLGKNIWALRLGADARINERFSVVGEIGASWRKNQDSRYIYGGVKYGW